MSAPDWSALSQAELDAGLNNSAAVPDSDEIVAGWKERSRGVRARWPQHLDLRYGPRERNRIDVLIAADRAPTLLFIHGGYWQFRAKEDFTFIATGPLEHGINVALMGYTLAPEITLDGILSEIDAGVEFLARNLGELVVEPGPVVAAGWSAGGHLAVAAARHERIAAALSISGVFDLEPVQHSYLNERLGLDREAARRNSPVYWVDDIAKPVSLAVGSHELLLLRDQTARYAAARSRKWLRTSYEEIEGCNHFTIMNEIAEPAGRITMLIQRLIEDSVR